MQLQKQRLLVPNVFQYEALQKLEETKKDKGVVVMPTGTGKTFLASLWFKKKLEVNPNAKLLFICHNKDILSQANEQEFQKCLIDLDIPYGYYNSKEKNIKQTTFATTQTLTRNLKEFNQSYFDYIIVDECHHYQAKSFKKVLEYFKPKFMLGLTATPNRMDGLNIYKILGEKVYEAEISDAIKKDLLTKINYYCVDNDIDFSNVKWNGSGYDEKDLNRKICVKEYDDAILKEYNDTLKRKFGKKKTICFCATVEHTHRMAKFFNDNGIKAIGLTGRNRLIEDKYPRGKRQEIIEGFRNGKYDIIFVRDLFNEGVNIPDCDSVMMLRPTKSHTIFTQQIGRGLRKSEGKDNLLILDFTGNARKCIINFEVLSKIIDLDIVEKVKQKYNQKNKDEIKILSNGCEVRLTKNKVNILNNGCRMYSKEALIFGYKVIKGNYFNNKKYIVMDEFIKLSGYSESNIRLHFGKWSNFLKYMGEDIPSEYRRDISKEEIITEYNRVKKLLGRIPISTDFCYKNKKSNVSEKVIRNNFGTWNNFLKEIGELTIYEIRENKYSKDELINIYKKLKENNKKITQNNFLKETSTSSNIFNKHFDSWNGFLRYIKEPPRSNILDEDIINDYKKIRRRLGKVPTQKEYDKFGEYTHGVMKRFGSYGNFLKKVGDYKNHQYLKGKLIDKQYIINKYLFIAGKGNYISFKEFYKKSNISQKKIEDFFGSYNNLIKLCCVNIKHRRKVTESKEDIIKEYKRVKEQIGKIPNTEEIKKASKYPFSVYLKLFNNKYTDLLKKVGDYEEWNKERIKRAREKLEIINRTNNIKIISKYKPKTIIIPVKQNRKGLSKTYKGMKQESFKTTDDKFDIREKIISKINDGDNVLLLESPELSALKEIKKQNKKPSKIIIPNNKEFKKLAEALQNYKTDLNIEVINTSALQYLVDSEEKFDFIWLDYCGAFSYYIKDLDILFQKHLNNMRLILTYNLFDPAKDDDSYYFTRVIDYVLSKTEDKNVRLINDITHRYKKQMYNLGFNIK